TEHEYDVVQRYRDDGGNLMFLAANNFFWQVRRDGRLLTKVALWRKTGRPEAALVGVQVKAGDYGGRQGAYGAHGLRWAFPRSSSKTSGGASRGRSGSSCREAVYTGCRENAAPRTQCGVCASRAAVRDRKGLPAGDVRGCNATRCVSIVNRNVLPAVRSLYSGPCLARTRR